MSEKTIPVLWEYNHDRPIGRATFEDGVVTMDIHDQKVIDAIKGPNYLRGLSLGSITTTKKENQMVSNSEFKFNFTLDIDDASIDEVNLFRKTLLSDVAHLKRCLIKTEGKEAVEAGKTTRRIEFLEEILAQTWDQLCEARAERHAVNGTFPVEAITTKEDI